MTLFGLGDRNLKLIRDALPVNLSAREQTLRVVGEKKPVEDAVGILKDQAVHDPAFAAANAGESRPAWEADDHKVL